jgi:hypothetical protein
MIRGLIALTVIRDLLRFARRRCKRFATSADD